METRAIVGMSAAEQAAFIQFCNDAETPMEFNARNVQQEAFLAGFRAGMRIIEQQS